MSITTVKLQIESMAEGESVRRTCPWCCGINTLSITRNFDSGLYNCYRASCGVKGFIPLNPLALPTSKPVPRVPKGILTCETLADRDTKENFYILMRDKYELDRETLFRNHVDLAIGIRFTNGAFEKKIGDGLWVRTFDFNYTFWGVYAKRLEGFSWNSDTKVWTARMNAETSFPYFVPIPKLPTKSGCSVIFVVEDPLSALKIAQLGYYSFALMGTHFQPNHVLELVKEQFTKIVWMLDPDTWQSQQVAKAEKLSDRIGPIISHKVVYMNADPKDTPLEDLEEICHKNSK